MAKNILKKIGIIVLGTLLGCTLFIIESLLISHMNFFNFIFIIVSFLSPIIISFYIALTGKKISISGIARLYRPKFINNKIFIIITLSIFVIIGISSLNKMTKVKEVQKSEQLSEQLKAAYNNISIENKISGLIVKKLQLETDDRFRMNFEIEKNYAAPSQDSIGDIEATIEYKDGTKKEAYWSKVDVGNPLANVFAENYNNISKITFNKYTGKIQAKQELALEEKKNEDELRKQQEMNETLRENIEKTRFTKLSDDGYTQKWRMYVEKGRTLQILGNAGGKLLITIHTESGNLVALDEISKGEFDRTFIPSNNYDAYYLVDFDYIRNFKYNWSFKVY